MLGDELADEDHFTGGDGAVSIAEYDFHAANRSGTRHGTQAEFLNGEQSPARTSANNININRIHAALPEGHKGVRTIVSLVDAIYEKGVTVFGSEKRDLEHRLQRSTDLNWWDITIHPKKVRL
jgi:hypothetical protein